MKNALIVIDFINDIVSPQGKIPSCAESVKNHQVIQKVNQAIEIARREGDLIIFVKVGFSKHYLEQPKQSPVFGKANQIQALTLGEWGTEFHPDLAVKSDDLIIVKPRISPFYGTSLEVILRTNQIEHLTICGVSTLWAIQAAVRDAHDRDYQITVLEDACAAATEEEHQLSIKQLSRIAKIISVDGMKV